MGSGNNEVRIQKLLRITQKVFTKNYPGALRKYIEDLDSAYSELDILDMKVADAQKTHLLLANLEEHVPDSEFLVHYCRDNFTTFVQCIKHLRRHAIRKEDVAAHTVYRRESRATRHYCSRI